MQGFSLNFRWGDSKLLVHLGPPMETKSDGGGGNLWKKFDWNQNRPPYAKLGPFFAILSMKYSFLRYFFRT